jgi:hypothetical protein
MWLLSIPIVTFFYALWNHALIRKESLANKRTSTLPQKVRLQRKGLSQRPRQVSDFFSKRQTSGADIFEEKSSMPRIQLSSYQTRPNKENMDSTIESRNSAEKKAGESREKEEARSTGNDSPQFESHSDNPSSSSQIMEPNKLPNLNAPSSALRKSRYRGMFSMPEEKAHGKGRALEKKESKISSFAGIRKLLSFSPDSDSDDMESDYSDDRYNFNSSSDEDEDEVKVIEHHLAETRSASIPTSPSNQQSTV